MIWLKQSTARTLLIGPFLDDTDGKTAETGLTISQADVRLSKNGGDTAQKNESTSCTHDELGYYTCPLDTTDTGTLGILKLMVHESGALPVFQDFMVVPANVWDSMFGADYLLVDVAEVSGDSTAADNLELMFDGTGYAGGTTKLGVDVVAISGDTSAADNAELDYDGTGYNKGGTRVLTSAYDHAKDDVLTPLAVVDGIVDDILEDTGTTIPASLTSISGKVDTVDNFIDTEVSAIQTGVNDLLAIIGEPATTTLCQDIGVVITDVDDLEARLTATRAGYLDNLSGGALATQASVNALDDYVDTEVAAIKAVTDKLDTALVLDVDVYKFTENALEEAPSGSGATPQQVWEYAQRSLTDKDGFTLHADYDNAKDDVLTPLSVVDGIVDDILVDTGTTLPASLTSISGKVDAVDNFVDTEVAAIKDVVDDISAVIGEPATTTVSQDIGVIITNVDDLEARLTATRAGYLDNLSGGAVALNSTVAKESTLAALNDFDPSSDTVAHVTLVDTVTTNSDNVSAASIADAVWDEPISSHVIAGTAGRFLQRVYRYFFNRRSHTNSLITVYADDGTTADANMVVTGDSTTVTKEAVS